LAAEAEEMGDRVLAVAQLPHLCLAREGTVGSVAVVLAYSSKEAVAVHFSQVAQAAGPLGQSTDRPEGMAAALGWAAPCSFT
jgi:hypothetical protein